MVSNEARGRAVISTLALLGAVLVVAGGIGAAVGPGSTGVFGAAASGNDSTADANNATSTATATATAGSDDTATDAPTATATESSTATATASATPTAGESKEVAILFEHWDDQVGIVVQGGADADAVTAYTVEGADMRSELDASAENPRAVGTVEAPTTVRVVATFEGGTEQVVGERTIE